MSSKIQLEAAQPDSTPRVAARRGGPFWSYGFRPFFVLAACAAIGTLIVLVAGFAGASGVSDALPLARWHGHEMVFGFVGAAIAGFLLTAVPSWTGTKAVFRCAARRTRCALAARARRPEPMARPPSDAMDATVATVFPGARHCAERAAGAQP